MDNIYTVVRYLDTLKGYECLLVTANENNLKETGLGSCQSNISLSTFSHFVLLYFHDHRENK